MSYTSPILIPYLFSQSPQIPGFPIIPGADPPLRGMPTQQPFKVVGTQDAVALHTVVVWTAEAREETQAVDASGKPMVGKCFDQSTKNNQTTCPNLYL